MYIAKNIDGVVFNLLKNPQIIKNIAYYCPSCLNEVRLRLGKIKQPHFAHLPNSDCSAFSENESLEHLALKEIFYVWSEEIQLEVYLPKLKQRPDCLLGKKLCLEIQCSSLSVERLAERTKNYRSQGYQVIWLLGKKFELKNRLSSIQRGCLNYSKKCGFYLWTLDNEGQKLVLNYHILEDVNGRIYFQQKIYPFLEGELQEILKISGIFTSEYEIKMEKILSKKHKENTQNLQKRERKTMHLQRLLYSQGLHLLKLPKYYYFPNLRIPLAQENVLIWKRYLYEYLMTGASWKECLDYFLSLSLPTIDSNTSKKEIVGDFLLTELSALMQLGCLRKSGEYYFIIPHETQKVIPYEYTWQKSPNFSSFLPRELCYNRVKR